MNTYRAKRGKGVGPIAVNKIAYPSIDVRRAMGTQAGQRSLHRVTRDGALLRADWTRSRCSRSRISPASRTWCRSGTAE
jgi:hypothetical protein